MNSSIIRKATAILSVLCGFLMIIGWTLNINRDSLTGAIMVTAGYTLSVLAYTGVFAYKFVKTNTLAFLGFLFLVIGNALFISFGFLDVARLSGVSPEIDWLLVQSEGPTYILGAVGGVSFMLGYLFFGLASFRARVVWRWVAIAFMLASIMPLLHPILGMGKLLIRIGSLALMAMGFSLWQKVPKK